MPSTFKTITAAQSRFAARIFNLLTLVVAVLAPLIMIWIAASIFVYASVAHHPNPRTVYYNRWAGYRFYGAVGSLLVLGPLAYRIAPGWHALFALWGAFAVIIVPWGLWDLYKTQREPWQDVVIEVENESV